MSKKDLYDLYMMSRPIESEYDDFIPDDYGFFIGKISFNGKILLDVHLNDENTNKELVFPMMATEPEPHTVVHNLQYHVESPVTPYGLGVICICTDNCHAHFKWYCNEQLILQGPRNWVHISPNVGDTYFCEHTCKQSALIIKEKLKENGVGMSSSQWLVTEDNTSSK